MSRHGFRQRALSGTHEKTAYADSTDRFLWDIHKYTNDYIRFADTKAAFVVAASTALVGTLVSSSIFESCFRRTPCQWSPLQWVALVGLLLLTASLFLSVSAVRPRLWNKTSIGYIFWESIAGHGSPQEFSRAVGELPARMRTRAISDHLFVLATVAKRKYAYVKLAIYTGLPGAALAGIALFMQHELR